MDKVVKLRLSIKKDYSSDLVEELRHIDKYFSKFINANVELIVNELDEDKNGDFEVALNENIISDPSVSKIVDMVNKAAIVN